MADLVEVLAQATRADLYDAAAENQNPTMQNYYRAIIGKHKLLMRCTLDAISAAGYRVVSVEPTEAMERAGCFALHNAEEALMAASLSGDKHATARVKMRLRWAAMVRAAPKVDSPAAEQEYTGITG